MTPNPDLSPELKSKIDSELKPGETIVWMARPLPPSDPGILDGLLHPEELYVITTQRAIRFYGNRLGLSSTSYTPDRLQQVKIVQRPDGSGDLIFQHVPGAKHGSPDFGFLRLPNVREADQLLAQTLGAKHL